MEPTEATPSENAGSAASAKVPTKRFAAGANGESQVEETHLPPGTSEGTIRHAINWEHITYLIVVVLGVLIIVLGVVLILLGFSGSVTWNITSSGINSKLQTGSLGIVIAVIGFLIAWKAPKPKVVVGSEPKTKTPKTAPTKKGNGKGKEKA